MAAYQVEHPNGDIEHYDKNGKYHRSDGGPSVCTSSSMMWHNHGVLHRTNGPAVLFSNGAGEMWINGNFLYETPPNFSTVGAAKNIQRAWREHQRHENFKPDSPAYYEAKIRWENAVDTELILPQM